MTANSKVTILFTIKDSAQGGETIPDRSYQLILNMLKNEVNISGAAYMGEEQVHTRAGKFDQYQDFLSDAYQDCFEEQDFACNRMVCQRCWSG